MLLHIRVGAFCDTVSTSFPRNRKSNCIFLVVDTPFTAESEAVIPRLSLGFLFRYAEKLQRVEHILLRKAELSTVFFRCGRHYGQVDQIGEDGLNQYKSDIPASDLKTD